MRDCPAMSVGVSCVVCGGVAGGVACGVAGVVGGVAAIPRGSPLLV